MMQSKIDQTANSNSGKSSKIQPSQTREKESSSKISDNSSTSLSQTQTGAVSGGAGTAGTQNKIEYVEIDLPATMINAIRIIERLLT